MHSEIVDLGCVVPNVMRPTCGTEVEPLSLNNMHSIRSCRAASLEVVGPIALRQPYHFLLCRQSTPSPFPLNI